MCFYQWNGKITTLLSPLFNIKEVTAPKASFWCHLFSRENRMGTLWVDVCIDGQWVDSVLYLTGDHGDQSQPPIEFLRNRQDLT
ncbi:MAG: hypothetical protein GX640_00455 [Fibrobacter sp.]|nr:hypothetical protein [Fibrobacter sp.]